ncbi:hypothetical protein LNP24_13565 [Klebsiella pneumoniae subsp. pneumoniae]|nr:hypothetical protein [Klebsiella pneumoniae subsp. pneumoniae]
MLKGDIGFFGAWGNEFTAGDIATAIALGINIMTGRGTDGMTRITVKIDTVSSVTVVFYRQSDSWENLNQYERDDMISPVGK